MNDEAKLDAQMPNSVLSHINLVAGLRQMPQTHWQWLNLPGTGQPD